MALTTPCYKNPLKSRQYVTKADVRFRVPAKYICTVDRPPPVEGNTDHDHVASMEYLKAIAINILCSDAFLTSSSATQQLQRLTAIP